MKTLIESQHCCNSSKYRYYENAVSIRNLQFPKWMQDLHDHQSRTAKGNSFWCIN